MEISGYVHQESLGEALSHRLFMFLYIRRSRRMKEKVIYKNLKCNAHVTYVSRCL